MTESVRTPTDSPDIGADVGAGSRPGRTAGGNPAGGSASGVGHDQPSTCRPSPAPGHGLAEGLTVWLTGLPCAGKTTIANGLATRLTEAGFPVEVLDGDEVRSVLGPELGFGRADRDVNVRRVGWVANLLSRHGVVVICALVSPYRTTRDQVRAAHGGRFFEVLVSAPLVVCSRRDVKGLYARQCAGAISGLTGVDDPYEPPLHPELVVQTHTQSVGESVEAVWQALPR